MKNNLWLVKRNVIDYRNKRAAKGLSTFDLTAFNEWVSRKSAEYIEMLTLVPVDELNTFWQNDLAWAARGLEDPCFTIYQKRRDGA